MDKIDAKKKFKELISLPEDEVIEFKEAKNNFDFDDLGKYFSALSNEANIRGYDYAWLVFGVRDKGHEVVGTKFKDDRTLLNKLKQDISRHTEGNHTFKEIFEEKVNDKRVLLFQIPASPRNTVMRWKGMPYARNGESLVPLSQSKQDEIRNQSPVKDWSAEIVHDATLKDLDDLAVAKARIEFAKVHKRITKEEIDSWSLEEFLSNSGVMQSGKLTNAAILLLGKPLSAQKIAPAVAQISWALNDENGFPIDYEHFTVPYILTVDNVLGKIRNLTIQELPGDTLFPNIEQQYDDYTMRETLHNCIAHMDYRLQERITVVENPDSLCFSNGGTFVPGDIESVLDNTGPQRFYRNRCLCNAMFNFNMIDTIGRGIKKIFHIQKDRFFPMPDYDIDNDKREVKVTLYGKAIDERYTKLLKESRDLSLQECIWLDAIQKHRPVTKSAIKELKAKNLIEGRYPHYVISLNIAKKTDQIGHYTKEKGLDYDILVKIALQVAKNAGNKGFMRKDALIPMQNNLPFLKDYESKERFVGRLLKKMSNESLIYLDNNDKTWKITPKGLKTFEE